MGSRMKVRIGADASVEEASAIAEALAAHVDEVHARLPGAGGLVGDIELAVGER